MIKKPEIYLYCQTVKSYRFKRLVGRVVSRYDQVGKQTRLLIYLTIKSLGKLLIKGKKDKKSREREWLMSSEGEKNNAVGLDKP